MCLRTLVEARWQFRGCPQLVLLMCILKFHSTERALSWQHCCQEHEEMLSHRHSCFCESWQPGCRKLWTRPHAEIACRSIMGILDVFWLTSIVILSGGDFECVSVSCTERDAALVRAVMSDLAQREDANREPTKLTRFHQTFEMTLLVSSILPELVGQSFADPQWRAEAKSRFPAM